ncbi:ictacalcin [Arapaima gigas]
MWPGGSGGLVTAGEGTVCEERGGRLNGPQMMSVAPGLHPAEGAKSCSGQGSEDLYVLLTVYLLPSTPTANPSCAAGAAGERRGSELRLLSPLPAFVTMSKTENKELLIATAMLCGCFSKYAGCDPSDPDKGTLSKGELKKMLDDQLAGVLDKCSDKSQLDNIFKGLDQNRDGKVDFNEFLILFASIAMLFSEAAASCNLRSSWSCTEAQLCAGVLSSTPLSPGFRRSKVLAANNLRTVTSQRLKTLLGEEVGDGEAGGGKGSSARGGRVINPPGRKTQQSCSGQGVSGNRIRADLTFRPGADVRRGHLEAKERRPPGGLWFPSILRTCLV